LAGGLFPRPPPEGLPVVLGAFTRRPRPDSMTTKFLGASRQCAIRGDFLAV